MRLNQPGGVLCMTATRFFECGKVPADSKTAGIKLVLNIYIS